MRATILGCGGAGGVPLIGNFWGDCDPAEPKNRRTRVSLLVEEGAREEGATLLFDTSPDMREQLLRAKVKDVTAVFYTHAHADHAHGIDNIRSVNWMIGRSLPLYADTQTLTELRTLFPYVFGPQPVPGKFYCPDVEPHVLEDGKTLTIGGLKIVSFHLPHGSGHTRGFRINDFGYTTDASEMTDEAFDLLRGVKVWVVGAIRYRPHKTHANVARALEWIAQLNPERAYLTHMNETIDYGKLKAELPAHIEPAYDGLQIEL